VALPKLRDCATCNREFQPQRFGQKTCRLECALAHGRDTAHKKKIRAFSAETAKRKSAIKTRSKWMKEAQVEFNKFIRTRDRHRPCVSCGTVEGDLNSHLTGGAFDCGHYLGTGSHPELRFFEFNAAKQCKKCNRQLSGNHGPYRVELIKRVGQSMVNFLEGPHEPCKYTIEDLQHIKVHFRDKAKLAQKAAEEQYE